MARAVIPDHQERCKYGCCHVAMQHRRAARKWWKRLREDYRREIEKRRLGGAA